jgi:hypothetical protein
LLRGGGFDTLRRAATSRENRMRIVHVVSLLALMYPAIAMAQGSPPATPAEPATATTGKGHARGADFTRDEYIQRAVERARKSAATRFDKMDANHDGILTADERRAARAARKAREQ